MAALIAGARLGPYELQRLLGAGGMGEVYRARDTRLDRTVAIKILRETHPDLQSRFAREARAIAALAHPHICTLFDIGREAPSTLSEIQGRPQPGQGPTGSGQVVDFLVMECLEGESLAVRVKRGALPIDQVLKTAIEIGDALDTAHRAGIIHRDLKPSNVMLTKAGAKLLDFGLAKFHAVPDAADPAVTISQSLSVDGALIGTVPYMAPEQLEGRQADARSDLFAFGAMLYEMLTGRRAFAGESQASVIAAILETDPTPIGTTQPLTPPALDRVVRKCLAKDPDARWQTARDMVDELKWIAGMAAPDPALVAGRARWLHHRALPWALAGALASALALVLMRWAPWRTAPHTGPVHLTVELGASLMPINVSYGDAAVLSPDGAVLAYVAPKGTTATSQLYVRRLDQPQTTALPGTDDSAAPFFSQDGRWIGFAADGKLKKIAVTGGAAVTLADAPELRGGTWGEDGTIVFSPGRTAGQRLKSVPSTAGKAELLTSLAEDEVIQHWPQVLPGGRAVLYTASSVVGAYNDAYLVVQPLPGGTRKVVQRGGYHGRYLPSGHLVYIHDGTLFAVAFDLDRLEVTGEAVPALEGVRSNAITGGSQFSVSDSGTLVYLPGPSTGAGIPIDWMDRRGKTTRLRVTPANWFNLTFSPDGDRLAMEIREGQPDIWMYELARETPARLTTDPAQDTRPVWSPGGHHIAFASARGDKTTLNLYLQRIDGKREARHLSVSENAQEPFSWHPSGKFLAYQETTPTGVDVMILPMEGDDASDWTPGKPFAFLNSRFQESEPTFSPDGRWIAYLSNETGGPMEVFVRPFPGPGGGLKISTGGGYQPTWSRAKQELLYGVEGQIMVVDYKVEGDSFSAEKPRLWSEGRYQPRGRPNRMFDLHRDGERVALAPDTQTSSVARVDTVDFIFNFFDHLRRIAPPTRR